MPFVELLAPPVDDATRQHVATAVTQAVCDAFAVGPEIVTIYVLPVAPSCYAHAGRLAAAGPQCVFVKVHAYRRTADARRRLAAAMTAPLARLFGIPDAAVVLYFLDRAKDEVAHDGVLACDLDEG